MEAISTESSEIVSLVVYLYVLIASCLILAYLLRFISKRSGRDRHWNVTNAYRMMLSFSVGYAFYILHGIRLPIPLELDAILGDIALIYAAVYLLLSLPLNRKGWCITSLIRFQFWVGPILLLMFVALEWADGHNTLRATTTLMIITALHALAFSLLLVRLQRLDTGYRVILLALTYSLVSMTILPMSNREGVSTFEVVTAITLSQLPFFLGYSAGIVISIMTRFSQKLETEASRDWLTGLLNRRYMHAYIMNLIRAGESSNRRLYFMLIDIDDFKAINDQYGHSVGDHVLQSFAERVNSIIREDDCFCRLGGEEFGLFALSETDDEVMQLAERIRHRVESQLHSSSGLHEPVTISIGITPVADAFDVEPALKRADWAMYRVKQSGKNQFAFG